MHYTVTALDTAGIQKYIFNSNELRENIGASELALRATTVEVFRCLKELGEQNNIIELDKTKVMWGYDEQADIFAGNVKVEVVYAGGGNTLLIFGGANHRARAKKLVYHLSRNLLKFAPGLNLFAAHANYTTDGNLAKTVNQVMTRLAELKSELGGSIPTLGLSVTAACTSTGLPANPARPLSDKRHTAASRANEEVRRKWKTADKFAVERLQSYFDIGDFKWTEQLDEIGHIPGRDESFVAVVHADGNGMGKRIIQMGQLFAKEFPNDPRAYINAMRLLSIKLGETAQTAIINTVMALREELLKRDKVGERFFYVDQNKNWCFPFRPIVFGGDDVTWVCAGVWGIALAHRYLKELEKLTLPSFKDLLVDNGRLSKDKVIPIVDKWQEAGELPTDNTPYACAGVAIVKTHYPFSRAYDISEELVKVAKKQVLAFDKMKAASAIDWHFTTTGLTGSLTDIRKREYVASQKDENGKPYNLIARPLMLDSTQPTWRNWHNFHEVWREFDNAWFDSRNKVVALRDALRSGPNAVQQFKQVERKGPRLPRIRLRPQTDPILPSGGWITNQVGNASTDEMRCVYFDAIEVGDLYQEVI